MVLPFYVTSAAFISVLSEDSLNACEAELNLNGRQNRRNESTLKYSSNLAEEVNNKPAMNTDPQDTVAYTKAAPGARQAGSAGELGRQLCRLQGEKVQSTAGN